MPRSGDNYALPSGTIAITLTTIASDKFNAFANDVSDTFNTVQPVIYGGTGRNNLTDFKADLGFATDDDVTFQSLTLTSTDAGATAAPVVTLNRNSASPAADDILGKLLFKGKDGSGGDQDYSEVYSQIKDATAGSEDADLVFRTVAAGTMTTLLTLNASGAAVTSLTATGTITATDTITVVSTDAGSGIGPELILDRNSASPAASDGIGSVGFRGRDSGGNSVTYARIDGIIDDPADGSEDGALILRANVAGSLTQLMRLDANGLTLPAAINNIYFGSNDWLTYDDSTNIWSVRADGTVADAIFQAGTLHATAAEVWFSGSGNDKIGYDDTDNIYNFYSDSSVNNSKIRANTFFTNSSILSDGGAFNGIGVGINYTDGSSVFSQSGGVAIIVNRAASDGNAQTFRRSATQVGSISVTTTNTAFNTSSDERLKDFIGEYTYDEAISIILADPVREFTWKVNGSHAVGWGAQTSLAISPDLANYDAESDSYGVDQGKRTPYLWVAAAEHHRKIAELTARIEALEGAVN